MNEKMDKYAIKNLIIYFALILSTVFFASPTQAQTHRTTTLEGIVTDSVTGERLPYVNIVFDENKGLGTTTGRNGQFRLVSPEGYRTFIVSFVGYASKTIVLQSGETRKGITIRLSPESVGLTSLIVRPKKQKYSRKDNPAVELIRRAVRLRDENHIEAAGAYSYTTYERIILSEDNCRRNMRFMGLDSVRLSSLIDSSSFTQQLILPLSLREKITCVAKATGQREESRAIAQHLAGIDELLDEGPVTNNIDEIFRPIDIYKPDIPILLQRIPGPLNPTFATGFYKYFIQDTVEIQGTPCIELSFVPFAKHAAGFTGRIWLTQPDCAVRRIELNMPIASHINWVKRLRITQEFEPKTLLNSGDSVGRSRTLWVPSRQDMQAIISGEDLMLDVGIDARQTRIFTDYRLGSDARPLADSLLAEPDGRRAPAYDKLYWQLNRPTPLPPDGLKVLALMDELRSRAGYKASSLVLHTLLTGYFSVPPVTSINSRPLFDIGPVHTFLSYNDIEGFRPRFGGMTTANLMQHIFLDGYLAYGFRDNRFKYRASLTYTPLRKQYHAQEYPRNNLSATIQRDLFNEGQAGDLVFKDDVMSLLGTTSNRDRRYINFYILSHELDWSRSFTSTFKVEHQDVRPTGSLHYERILPDGAGTVPVRRYRTTAFAVNLRWEPLRVVYNGRRGANAKFNLARRGPTFQLSHQMTFKGVLGSDYSQQRTDLRYDQKIWLSLFGHLSLQAFAGIVWDKAPYPILEIPPANQSYTLNESAFQLMRPGEYIADRWAGLHATYHLDGLFIDRIPLLRKTRVREIVSGHLFYGDMARPNRRPEAGMYLYPPEVEAMHGKWYAEGSIGLENIFRLLRVDYFYRFTDRNKPGVPLWGLRFFIQLRF